jgi:hypothetical protein
MRRTMIDGTIPLDGVLQQNRIYPSGWFDTNPGGQRTEKDYNHCSLEEYQKGFFRKMMRRVIWQEKTDYSGWLVSVQA